MPLKRTPKRTRRAAPYPSTPTRRCARPPVFCWFVGNRLVNASHPAVAELFRHCSRIAPRLSDQATEPEPTRVVEPEPTPEVPWVSARHDEVAQQLCDEQLRRDSEYEPPFLCKGLYPEVAQQLYDEQFRGDSECEPPFLCKGLYLNDVNNPTQAFFLHHHETEVFGLWKKAFGEECTAAFFH